MSVLDKAFPPDECEDEFGNAYIEGPAALLDLKISRGLYVRVQELLDDPQDTMHTEHYYRYLLGQAE